MFHVYPSRAVLVPGRPAVGDPLYGEPIGRGFHSWSVIRVGGLTGISPANIWKYVAGDPAGSFILMLALNQLGPPSTSSGKVIETPSPYPSIPSARAMNVLC